MRLAFDDDEEGQKESLIMGSIGCRSLLTTSLSEYLRLCVVWCELPSPTSLTK